MYLRRICHIAYVFVTYVRRIGLATYVSGYEFLSAHIKKHSTSAYEEYELRIVEYELRMLTYVRRTRDGPFVY